MAKIKDSVWSIFGKSVKLYFQNFTSFFKYLAFPVLGQILGIILTVAASYFYAENIQKLIATGGIFNNFSMIFLILILISLPGLFIFAKAFWDYLVAYGAINSMTENMLKSGKVYDFPAHTALITRRTPSFVGLWLLVGFFSMIASFPLLWVAGWVFFVYFILIFQVFTFEPDKSPVGCFRKSMEIIKGNFLRTIGLTALVGIFTYLILPEIIKLSLEFLNLTNIFAIPFEKWVSQLPINEINKMLKETYINYEITPLFAAKLIVTNIIYYCVICFTLPLRSICWSQWYKLLNKGEMKLDKKILDRAGAKD